MYNNLGGESEEMIKDKPFPVRTDKEDRTIISALVDARVAKNASDCFRLGIRALAKNKKIKVITDGRTII